MGCMVLGGDVSVSQDFFQCGFVFYFYFCFDIQEEMWSFGKVVFKLGYFFARINEEVQFDGWMSFRDSVLLVKYVGFLLFDVLKLNQKMVVEKQQFFWSLFYD